MGPNCNLKSMFGSDNEIEVSQSDKESVTPSLRQNSDRFSRLSSMAEERKVNLFFLKDIALNTNYSMLERLDALG